MNSQQSNKIDTPIESSSSNLNTSKQFQLNQPNSNKNEKNIESNSINRKLLTSTGVSDNLYDSKTDCATPTTVCCNTDNMNDTSCDTLVNKICNNSCNVKETKNSKCKTNCKQTSRNSRRNGGENGIAATKSVGTQYNSIKRIKNVKNEKNEKNLDGEIVVISNEFRDKALDQECVIDKRKILKLLKTRKNIDWRSMDDMHVKDPNVVNNNQSSQNGSLTNGTKNVISKSDSLVASVELIFIPDECLQETPKKVYILKDNVPGLNKTILSKIQNNGNGAEQKEIFFISDGYRRNSVKNNIVIVDDEPKRRKPLKYLKNSVQQSSVDDVNNKMVSHAFHSYDEEDDNLEKKELKNELQNS